ncbi:hypothetical protein [Bosea sp. 125]|nr:hypothetical protein [Bosea sp. 125]
MTVLAPEPTEAECVVVVAPVAPSAATASERRQIPLEHDAAGIGMSVTI